MIDEGKKCSIVEDLHPVRSKSSKKHPNHFRTSSVVPISEQLKELAPDPRKAVRLGPEELKAMSVHCSCDAWIALLCAYSHSMWLCVVVADTPSLRARR